MLLFIGGEQEILKKRKEKRRDSQAWKRFMKAILSQLPSYIKKYTTEEQIHLNEFLKILEGFNVDTISARQNQSTIILKYIQKHSTSEDYINLPFLWFTRRYLTNANLLLSTEGYYAEKYYRYLVENLRVGPNKKGAFNLIRNNVSLNDLSWEDMQYNSIRVMDPLTNEELQVIDSTYSLISQNELKAIGETQIRNAIKNKVSTNSINRNLSRFFSLCEARGRFWCFSPAFDLKQYYFNFRLGKHTNFTEICDFSDSSNTILKNSNIFRIKNAPNEYLGYFTVPIQCSDHLITLLKNYDQEKKITLNELSEISSTKFTTSFSLYQANNGWKFLTKSMKDQLTSQLIVKNPRKRKEQKKTYFSTRKFNSEWNFKRQDEFKPSKLIEFYCKTLQGFPFNDLSHFSKDNPEYPILKYLYNINICQFTLILYSLLYEFSLDFYMIKIPTIPSIQFSRLLNWLPFARIIYTDSNINIWAYLNSEMYQWMKEDLNWLVRPILLYHSPSNLDYNWFDIDKLTWKVPLILKN